MKDILTIVFSISIAISYGCQRQADQNAPQSNTYVSSDGSASSSVATKADLEKESSKETGSNEDRSSDSKINASRTADDSADTEEPTEKINGDRTPDAGSGNGKINSDRDTRPEGEGAPGTDDGVSCTIDASINQAKIDQWVATDKANNPSANRKYTHVPLDMLSNKEDANLARVAVFKALNHTAMDVKEIVVGEDISEGHCAVYAFSIEKLWTGRATANWQAVISAQGRQPFSPARPQSLAAFDGNASVPMDRLAYNVTHGNIYNELINTPSQEPGIRQRYNIQDEVIAWGAVKQAIVFGPRIFWLRKSADNRFYWASGDRFDGQRGAEIPYTGNDTPQFKNGASGSQVTVFGTHASEAWIEMDNGFIAYFVWGNAQQERSKAEQSFVIDPGNDVNRDLITGRGCITCHLNGSQSAPSDLAGQGVWATNAQLGEFYSKTTTAFQAAMRTIVEAVVDADEETREKYITTSIGEEPVDAMIRRIEGQPRRQLGPNGLPPGKTTADYSGPNAGGGFQ